MRAAFGCWWACALGKQWCALRERFLGGAELRRAASAVMKQRLAALGDTRERWLMQRLCAESGGKTQRGGAKSLIPLVFLYSSYYCYSIAPRIYPTPSSDSLPLFWRTLGELRC